VEGKKIRFNCNDVGIRFVLNVGADVRHYVSLHSGRHTGSCGTLNSHPLTFRPIYFMY